MTIYFVVNVKSSPCSWIQCQTSEFKIMLHKKYPSTHRRMGRVSFGGGGGAEVSCPIFFFFYSLHAYASTLKVGYIIWEIDLLF